MVMRVDEEIGPQGHTWWTTCATMMLCSSPMTPLSVPFRRLALRSFRGMFEQYGFTEPYDLQSERPALDPRPWRVPITASRHDVQQEARVLQQPGYDRMMDGGEVLYPPL